MKKFYLNEEFDFDDLKYLAVELPDAVKFLKYSGEFQKEIELIDSLADKKLSVPMRKRLWLEKMIAEGMSEDYFLPLGDAQKILKKEFPLIDDESMKIIMQSGHCDYILKKGNVYLEDRALSNIKNELSNYLQTLKGEDNRNYENVPSYRKQIAEKMMKSKSAAFKFTLKEHFRIPESSILDERLYVHLPYPLELPYQQNITLIDSSCPVYINNGPIRTAFASIDKYRGEDINITFSFIAKQTYHNHLASDVSTGQPDFYTNEQYPHIRFTPYLVSLAKDIAKDEKNPLVLAKRVYDYVTKNIKYSYLRDYIFIDNITEFTALNGRGDCGAQALLFITLCRILGIPAKWESGKSINRNYVGSHDWAMFYVAPFGWLFVDLSSGGDAFAKHDETLRNFYFGNVDPLRMAANSEFQMQFDPPKKFMRCDPYDNQSGEAEFESKGVDFSERITSTELISMEEID